MVKLGTIKTAGELGRRYMGKLIWAACKNCSKEHWVSLSKGRPVSEICFQCSSIQQSLKTKGTRLGASNPNWKEDKEAIRDRKRKEHRLYNKTHRKEINRKSRLRNRATRKELLEFLGGKCVKCGFDDWRGLQIDHINGGGHQDIKSFKNTAAYWKAIRESFIRNEGKYQVLCANCNQIKRYEIDNIGGT